MIFVDGENLSIRFGKMIEKGGKPNLNVKWEPGRFLWHQNLSAMFEVDLVRVSYYTSVVGADDALNALQDRISDVTWKLYSKTGQIVPRVFKKAKGGEKTKSVDINIAIDVLRHTFANDIDAVILMSGDGDYLPLLREVMRQGKQAFVAAFSSGLNPAIKRTVDSFRDLDWTFFVR